MLAWYWLFTKHYVYAERYTRDMRHIWIIAATSYVFFLIEIKKIIKHTYRYALAFDAIHDSEGRSQVREPCRAQFANLLAESAFWKERKNIASLSIVVSITILPPNNISDVNIDIILSDLWFHHLIDYWYYATKIVFRRHREDIGYTFSRKSENIFVEDSLIKKKKNFYYLQYYTCQEEDLIHSFYLVLTYLPT